MQRVKSVSNKSIILSAAFAAALALTLPVANALACEHAECSAEHKHKDCKDCTKEKCKCDGCEDGECKHDHKHADKKAAKKPEAAH